jgi:hypothetical protein
MPALVRPVFYFVWAFVDFRRRNKSIDGMNQTVIQSAEYNAFEKVGNKRDKEGGNTSRKYIQAIIHNQSFVNAKHVFLSKHFVGNCAFRQPR